MGLPKRFPDRDDVAAVRAEAEQLEAGQEAEETRRLAGRVLARRDHGKLTFLDLVDRSGRLQLFCQSGRVELPDLDLGDVVGVEGKPMKSRRGEPSLAPDSVELLAKIRRPLPDTFHGVKDTELRYRQRYLDLLVNEETRADFLLRARMVTAIRRYLDDRGFVEVETPVLQPRYGGGFAEPFVTHYNLLDRDYYLRIATELYLKRLIVGGLERVYELAKDFRNEGVSYKHNPEFTMVEWYEAYADYEDTMARMEHLVASVADATLATTRGPLPGVTTSTWRLRGAASGSWTRSRSRGSGRATRDELRARLEERGTDTKQDRTWAQLIDHALSSYVEPSLVEPTILRDYPIELSPFARTTDSDPTIVERFEYFVGGMELGNAFTELNDPDEQAARFAMQAEEGAAGGGLAEPEDPDYVDALAYGMPPTGGLGLGIDRLAMVLSGRDTIRDVILFPALRDR